MEKNNQPGVRPDKSKSALVSSGSPLLQEDYPVAFVSPLPRGSLSGCAGRGGMMHECAETGKRKFCEGLTRHAHPFHSFSTP